MVKWISEPSTKLGKIIQFDLRIFFEKWVVQPHMKSITDFSLIYASTRKFVKNPWPWPQENHASVDLQVVDTSSSGSVESSLEAGLEVFGAVGAMKISGPWLFRV